MTTDSGYRRRLALAIFALVPLGIGTKFYVGPAAGWVQAHAGGVLYVVFWTLVVLWGRPALSVWAAAAGVLAVTVGLEGLQAWEPAFLEAVRNTFVGHALLGSTFSWLDLPHYAIGAGLGGGLGHGLRPGPNAASDEEGGRGAPRP
jgi:hypothetical protein